MLGERYLVRRTRSLAASTADEGVRRACGKPRGGRDAVSFYFLRTKGVGGWGAPDRADENYGGCSYYDIRLTIAYPYGFTRRVGCEVKKCSFALALRCFACLAFALRCGIICYYYYGVHFMSVTYIIYLHTLSSSSSILILGYGMTARATGF